MESVGEFFRQVRETKGLTVDEVASKTRIRTDFVQAIEEGNFAKLPDQVSWVCAVLRPFLGVG